MNLVLDSGILGQLCHPHHAKNRPVAAWLAGLLRAQGDQVQIYLPEIADYELRRKLLHMIAKRQATTRSIGRLDALADDLVFLPLDTHVMRRAAELWAELRSRGMPTAGTKALDADVILAAQTESVSGTVVTDNTRHLGRVVDARRWTDISSGPSNTSC